MKNARTFLYLTLFLALVAFSASAQTENPWVIKALDPTGMVDVDFQTSTASGTNGVLVIYEGRVMTADRLTVSQQTGDATAEGHVRIQQDNQVWTGDKVHYNFKTRQMDTEWFRTGRAPVFAQGEGLHGDISNGVYTAKNASVTTDDVEKPFEKVRANYIRIVPGQYIEARNAFVYLGEVPVFYFPFYHRTLTGNANHFNFIPGYRDKYGAYLLSSYTWYLNDEVDGVIHADYRSKRGIGVGPDVNLHLDRWGEATFKYYYLYDQKPDEDDGGLNLGYNRQRFDFSYNATPFTNLNVKSRVRYQNDPRVVREFFEGEYRKNPQPDTWVEVNKFWSNFSLDVFTSPRINDFLQTVERLPDIRLSGFRQQLWNLPVYYESESSLGYYRQVYPETNTVPPLLDYEAARADTYHQLLLPKTFFGWLNVTPRAGGRFTYYDDASGPGGVTDDHSRFVFNTGAEVSFKASRLWRDATNSMFRLDGLRHIFQPTVNYVYVPSPSDRPQELPQFDTELPSLRLLPNEYPGYNAIDSIDSQNVLRFGMDNKFQTKRDGEVVDLLDWNIYTDWRLHPNSGQTTFADLYNDIAFRPRSWIEFESLTRYDLDAGRWRMSFTQMTLRPNELWSWSLGHFYLRDDLSGSATALGEGNNIISSTLFVRLNENWGARATQHYEIEEGRMQEQIYTLYRDMRSWTAGLSFRVRDNQGGGDDFTVAFTFSLKAQPKYKVGDDVVKPYELLGY